MILHIVPLPEVPASCRLAPAPQFYALRFLEKSRVYALGRCGLTIGRASTSNMLGPREEPGYSVAFTLRAPYSYWFLQQIR